MMQVPTSVEVDLTMILFGGLEIQNAAGAASQIKVWTDQEITIHSGPGTPYAVLKTIPAGEILWVNACNCTHHWFRTILADGRVGWLLARNVSVLGEETALPLANADTPVYQPMQAFTLHSEPSNATCADTALAGMLIQAPVASSAVPLQINGVALTLNSTIFVQSAPESGLKIKVLEGIVHVNAPHFTALAPVGTQVIVPLSADNLPIDGATVIPYQAEDIAQLPLELLPTAIDPLSALSNPTPQMVGQETCVVVSDAGATLCPLHFVNFNGDALARMEVTFVAASQGDWSGSVIEAPQVMSGTWFGGQIAWEPTCSLGGANFIGPVKWHITLTDAQGHVSPPFEVSFNCIDG
jgi:hypothetical protein